jgi:uncharacterized protein (TIGR03790 family)
VRLIVSISQSAGSRSLNARALVSAATVSWILSAIFLAASQFPTPGATNPGDEVVVVYNTRVPESKSIAEYYAEKRQVPANQIFGLALSTKEVISRGEFRDELQKPLSKSLEREKLWHIGLAHVSSGPNRGLQSVFKVVSSKIRYAVLCYGIPLRIEEDPTIKEEMPEKLRPEQRDLTRNGAAVDTELALLPLMDVKLPLNGPLRNWAYGATNVDMLHPTNGILMVTRLDGPTPEIARALVDKALAAETDGLWGRAYFDLRNTSDPGFKLGDDWIRGAAETSRRAGFETIMDENPATFPAGFPMSQIAIYMGWYAGDVEGPFAQPEVEFMPGAIAYHLHSNSGASLRSTDHFWVGPFLAKGATVTMGCVWEPYLPFTPDVSTFLSLLVTKAYTFGQAAYAGLPALSWQITIVGDPLYKPFGREPDELQKRLEEQHSKLAEWSYLRMANLSLTNGRPASEVAQVIENIEALKPSAVLEEKLGDLYAGLGKPSSSIDAYEKALKYEPSHIQKLRLLMTLAEKLAAANEPAAAYTNYQTILRDFPGYPDKLGILQKSLPLVRKLNNTNEVEQIETEIKKLSPAAK